MPIKKIKKIIKNDKYVTLDEIKNVLEEENDIMVSKQTIANRLNEMKYEYKTPINKPPLTGAHIEARLEWAIEHSEFDFGNVIFSDETSIWLRFYDKRWVNCNKDINDYDHIPRHTMKLNVWGYISLNHGSKIYIFTEKLNAALYEQILRKYIKKLTDKNKDIIYQDDNDPKHRSKRIKAFKEKYNISSLEWPSNSPDLNPIENIWALLKKNIKKYAINDINDFKAAVTKSWNEISQETINNTILSIDNRVQEVIKREGDSINY